MKKKKIIIGIIAFILIAGFAVMGYLIYRKLSVKPVYEQADDLNTTGSEIVAETKKSIFDGNDRPIAVMIDNNKDALPHAGLSKAYMVYEIIVEGGESRLMALFKGQDIDKIGPVRSSRHYFLDYALENDAIYVHYGWSPKAESDIKAMGVNNINGLTNDSVFWRVKDKVSPHNAVTSTKRILEFASKKGYRTTSNSSSVLKYAREEVELPETAIAATSVNVPFSQSNLVKWTYDAETQTYARTTKGKAEVEWDSKENVKFKNIIVEFVKNTKLQDRENKDRQNLSNIGTMNGYYITNGKATKITCQKVTRTGKTKYLDADGKEIEVNDGNTFVEICPIDAKVTFGE